MSGASYRINFVDYVGGTSAFVFFSLFLFQEKNEFQKLEDNSVVYADLHDFGRADRIALDHSNGFGHVGIARDALDCGTLSGVEGVTHNEKHADHSVQCGFGGYVGDCHIFYDCNWL